MKKPFPILRFRCSWFLPPLGFETSEPFLSKGLTEPRQAGGKGAIRAQIAGSLGLRPEYGPRGLAQLGRLHPLRRCAAGQGRSQKLLEGIFVLHEPPSTGDHSGIPIRQLRCLGSIRSFGKGPGEVCKGLRSPAGLRKYAG